MSDMRLRTRYEDGMWAIQWYDPSDPYDEDGLCLGERLRIEGSEEQRAEAKEHNDISEVLAREYPPHEVHHQRLYWESEAAAKRAATIARRILRELRGAAPWPDWAIAAQAAGWKPPRGWRP